MPVFVRYQVPVLVEVEEGQVVSVRVDDESIAGPDGTIDTDRPSIEAPELASEIRVAESTDWPAWQIGI